MEEKNLVPCESTASETPVLTHTEHSLEPGLAENKPFKKDLIENEPNPEEQPKGTPLATMACSPQITPNLQHGNSLDAKVTNSLKNGSQFEIPPSPNSPIQLWLALSVFVFFTS